MDATALGLIFGQVLLAVSVVCCVAMIIAVARRIPASTEEASSGDDSQLIGADTQAVSALFSETGEPGTSGLTVIAVLSFHCTTCRAVAQGLLKDARSLNGVTKQLLVMGPEPSAEVTSSHPITTLMSSWPSRFVNFGDPSLGELGTLSILPTFLVSRRNVVVGVSHNLAQLKLSPNHIS